MAVQHYKIRRLEAHIDGLNSDLDKERLEGHRLQDDLQQKEVCS